MPTMLVRTMRDSRSTPLHRAPLDKNSGAVMRKHIIYGPDDTSRQGSVPMARYKVKEYSESSEMEKDMNTMDIDGFQVISVLVNPAGKYVVSYRR